ncbi:hypothetical protein MKX03_005671 [Papaver bracteatum]|nr:hypothetical protein MKX03_005671 [Papaver bracteatum]
METPYPKPINQNQTRIRWIGIGVMGQATAYRTPQKASSLQQKGAIIVNSPSDGDNRVLSGLNKGGVLIDTTSSDPVLAKEIASKSQSNDCFAIDSPVSGGDIGARDGKSSILAGGDSDVDLGVDRVVRFLGLSEGLVFAEKAGLDMNKFVESIRGGAAGSMVMELFGKRMIERDFRAGGFATYMVKDLGMGVNGGEGKDAMVLPGAALSKQLFSSMVANGDGNMGTQGLITVIERINGKSV